MLIGMIKKTGRKTLGKIVGGPCTCAVYFKDIEEKLHAGVFFKHLGTLDL